MATDVTSLLRQGVKLGIVALIVGPLLARWGFVGADFVPAVSTELLVRAAGLALVGVVLGLLVRQKRGARGQRSSADAPEEAADRRVEGSGAVYAPDASDDRQRARRGGRRVRERAEEVTDAERDAARRR